VTLVYRQKLKRGRLLRRSSRKSYVRVRRDAPLSVRVSRVSGMDYDSGNGSTIYINEFATVAPQTPPAGRYGRVLV